MMISISADKQKYMSPPSFIIFDCDGVLVDSEHLSHSVLQQMLAEWGVQFTLRETLDHFMGRATATCLADLEVLMGRAVPHDFLSCFHNRTIAEFRVSLKAVPGIGELLTALTKPFCVASNGTHEKMAFTLQHTGLLPHFGGRIFSAEDVPRPKPAPDLFLHAARMMKAAPANCLVVEDSPIGVVAAKSAGMSVAGYAAMGQTKKLRDAGADLVFHHMAELKQILMRPAADA